jgi:cytochrome c5
MADQHSNEQRQSEVHVSSSFFWGVIGSIVIPVALIMLAAYIVYSSYIHHSPIKEDPKVVAERIKPIGEVEVKDPNAPVILKTGENVFKGLCINCHGAGLLGAPKAGDKAAWSKVIAQGQDTVFSHALKGIRSMPPKGGNPDLEDVEVQRAAVYMANLAGANWKEPSAPLPTKAAATPAAKPKEVAAAPLPAMPTTMATPKEKVNGETIFNGTCVACHGMGIAGAPKAGDKAAWSARLSQGKPALYQHALQGLRAMPAKGGNAALSDEEVKAAVGHLISLVK